MIYQNEVGAIHLMFTLFLFLSSATSFAVSEIVYSKGTETPSSASVGGESFGRVTLPIIEAQFGTFGKKQHNGECNLSVEYGEIGIMSKTVNAEGKSGGYLGGRIPGGLIQPDMKLQEGYHKSITSEWAGEKRTATATFKNGLLHVVVEVKWSTGSQKTAWDIHTHGSLKEMSDISYRDERLEDADGWQKVNGDKPIPESTYIQCGEVTS